MRRIDKQVKYQMDFEQLNFEIKRKDLPQAAEAGV